MQKRRIFDVGLRKSRGDGLGTSRKACEERIEEKEEMDKLGSKKGDDKEEAKMDMATENGWLR